MPFVPFWEQFEIVSLNISLWCSLFGRPWGSTMHSPQFFILLLCRSIIQLAYHNMEIKVPHLTSGMGVLGGCGWFVASTSLNPSFLWLQMTSRWLCCFSSSLLPGCEKEHWQQSCSLPLPFPHVTCEQAEAMVWGKVVGVRGWRVAAWYVLLLTWMGGMRQQFGKVVLLCKCNSLFKRHF